MPDSLLFFSFADKSYNHTSRKDTTMHKVHVILAGIALLGTGHAIASVPVLETLSTVQDGNSRLVTVSYTLSGEPGIVTPFVQTNRGDGVWVDIPDEYVKKFAGDVNCVVQPGSRQVTWSPHKSWPGQFISDGRLRVGLKAWSTNTPPDYLVVDLRDGSKRYYQSADALPADGGVTNDLYKTYCYVLRRIPASGVEWLMGSPTNEYGRTVAREKLHHVAFTRDYYMAVYQMTQFQYKWLTGNNPSYYTNQTCWASRPVDSGSVKLIRGALWPAAVTADSLVGRLNSLTGLVFDEPSEAQWEYACRAGRGETFYTGVHVLNGTALSNEVVKLGRTIYDGGGERVGTSNVKWQDRNAEADHGTAPVGSYLPNDWGLYDMIGNCWEPCLDSYAQDIWTSKPDVQVDPIWQIANSTTAGRRGGSVYDSTFNRPAARSSGTVTQTELNGVRLKIDL